MIIAIHKKTGKETEITKEQKEQMLKHGSFANSYRFSEKTVRGTPPVKPKKSKDKE